MTITPRVRRILTAAALVFGAGLAPLAVSSAALADSDTLPSHTPSAAAMPRPSAEALLPGEEPLPSDGGGDVPVLPCPEEGCWISGGDGEDEEEWPVDGCVGDACDPEEEWTELDSGCFWYSGNPGHVYCPGEEHPVPLDEDGCYGHDGRVHCLGEVPGGQPEPCGAGECPVDGGPDCPITHVSAECRPTTPGDEPEDEPGTTPEDEPGATPGDEPGAAPRPGGDLPVTGPGLALVAGVGGLLTAVGAGGLLLYRRRGGRDGAGTAE